MRREKTTIVDLWTPERRSLVTYVCNCKTGPRFKLTNFSHSSSVNLIIVFLDSSSDGEDTSTVESSSADDILISSSVGRELLTNVDGQIRLEIGEFGGGMNGELWLSVSCQRFWF